MVAQDDHEDKARTHKDLVDHLQVLMTTYFRTSAGWRSSRKFEKFCAIQVDGRNDWKATQARTREGVVAKVMSMHLHDWREVYLSSEIPSQEQVREAGDSVPNPRRK
jgi:hypothetical protein